MEKSKDNIVVQQSNNNQNIVGRLISRYLTTDVIIFLGYLLITFLNAWDLQDRSMNPGEYTGGEGSPMWEWLNRSRIIYYFFTELVPIGYWGYFLFHIAFAISFYYISKQFKMNSLWIYAILLTLPILRYGLNDYGGRNIGLVALVMVWIYYYKRENRKKLYIIVSVIGFFTKEYCLYINAFFIIETFLLEIEFQNIKDLFKNLKSRIIFTLKTNTFEIILCVCYFIYRTIFTSLIGDYNPFDYGMFKIGESGEFVALIHLITHPKLWFVLLMIFGMLWIVLIKYPNLKVFTMLLFVTTFSSLFGLIWEIDKIGCIFIIIAFELLTPKIWEKKKEEKIEVS